MTWRDDATALWGEDFVEPMALVLDVNQRTVERWKAGQVEPPDGVLQDLQELHAFKPSDPKAVGAAAKLVALLGLSEARSRCRRMYESVDLVEAWMKEGDNNA